MADRILTLQVQDIVSGEVSTIVYDVTTSTLTSVSNTAHQVTKVSDA